MLNYLKKNIPLLIFVGLTVVVALVMTVLDIQKYIGYKGINMYKTETTCIFTQYI